MRAGEWAVITYGSRGSHYSPFPIQVQPCKDEAHARATAANTVNCDPKLLVAIAKIEATATGGDTPIVWK